jgi:hypothetical protein
MSDEIPEDVMKAAEAVTDAIYAAGQDTWLAAGTTDIIARAILAERERCAKIAEAEELTGAPPEHFTELQIALAVATVRATASSIASAIRSSHE